MEIEKDNFLTIDQVAEAFQLHGITIRKLIKEDKIPTIRIGRNIRIEKQGLIEYLKRKEEEK